MRLRPSSLGADLSLLQVLQYLFGIAAIVWVVQSADWMRIWTLVRRIPVLTFVAVLVASAFGIASRFYMWHVLVRELSPSRVAASARTDLVVNFINHLLPSRISGRSIAPAALRHFTGIGWNEAVAIAVLHTGLYAVFNGVVSLAGLAFGYPVFDVGVIVLILLSTIGYLAVGVLIMVAGWRLELVAAFIEYAARFASVVPVVGQRLMEALTTASPFVGDSAGTFRELTTRPYAVGLYTISWVAAVALFPGVRFWLLLSGLNAEFLMVFLLPVYLVTAYSVTVLPLTPGGIGVAEATGVLVFVSLGIDESVVIPVILLDRFLGVYLPALFGWYPLMQADLSDFGFETG